MQIDKLAIFRVCNPIKTPYTTAFGTANAFNSILVKLDNGKYEGWGEAAPMGFPGFSSETDVTAFHIGGKFLSQLIIGKDISSGNELQKIFMSVKGNSFAKGAFDMAWWDLNARMQKIPIKNAIGGTKEKVSAGYTLGVMQDIDSLLERIQVLMDSGYPRIKLKYCPGWDLDMVRSVRSAFPDLIMHIDCNSAYTLDDIDMFKKLDKYNLAMIEQPLMNDDLIDHAFLQKQIATPICLDESISSPTKARQAMQIKACRFINIKHGRVGGITNSLKIHNICQDSGVPCWIGAMCESALGVTFSMNLATLPNVKYPSDITPSAKFYERNLCKPIPDNPKPGLFIPSEEHGIGVVPDSEMLKKTTLDQFELLAN
ncbi:MAG: o-succinylbenzoate synthase [Lentisphaerae bacterium]|nr:o-succinylbenzoate synthase [Lentisphaerota bacterium]MCP4101602.1 o-succinylbenzoate synthase [Lentisphaerota bacterium]